MRIHYSRAIARKRVGAGDPGGVFVSATADPVCITVILCLKSSGNEI